MKAHCLLLVLCAVLAAPMAACGDGDGPASNDAQDVIAFGARDGDQYGLYLVRPDGGGLRRLTSEPGAVSFPRWSPDGGRIAYAVLAEEQGRPATLRLHDLATGNAVTVSEQTLAGPSGPAATWSPDGKRLAFIEDADRDLLRVYDIESGELIDMPDVLATTAEWSPSGKDIVFVGPDAAGETDLYLIDPNEENVRLVVQRAGLEGGPRWSPDGERIAFWSAPAGEPKVQELLVLDVESGELTELGSGSGAAWSPDGQRLAYSGGATEAGDLNLDVYLIAADGGERRALNRAITVDHWATWSPGGDALAYLAEADRQTAFICLVQLEPENRDCLDLGDLVPGAPAWSPE
jgi:TolB protein